MIPANRIVGPNPFDHFPGVINAPAIGIPVSAAIPLHADINPNLSLTRRQIAPHLPPIFFMGEIIATQTVNRLMNPPLTNP
jgi:hypothetical protein